jgi:hypothetical protein
MAVAGILVLAGWLRLRHLGLAEYGDDEAIALRIAHDILKGDIRTVGLASSSGAANPPLYVYMAAVIVAIRDSVALASATVAVASLAAIGLTYVLAERRFGRIVALTAAALFATAPWAVLFGRHFWQQDYLPLVTVGLLWSLLVVLERSNTRCVALVPVLLVVAFQLNMSAVTLVVPVVAVLAYRARDVNWRAAIAGAILGVLSLAPWLAHVAKHGFHDVGLIFANGRGHHGGSTGGGGLEALRQTIHLVSAEGWGYETGASHQSGLPWVLGRAAGIAVLAFLLVAVVRTVVLVARERRSSSLDTKRRALLVVWLAGVCVAYLPSKTSGVGPHYLLVSYPASFLLAAIGLRDVVGAAPRRAALASAVVVTAVAAGFVAFTLSFQSFVQRHGGTAGAYGVVYDHSVALATAVRNRHLHVGFARSEYLVTGHLQVPEGTPPSDVVTVRDRLRDDVPLTCSGRRRTFGPLEACFPR